MGMLLRVVNVYMLRAVGLCTFLCFRRAWLIIGFRLAMSLCGCVGGFFALWSGYVFYPVCLCAYWSGLFSRVCWCVMLFLAAIFRLKDSIVCLNTS